MAPVQTISSSNISSPGTSGFSLHRPCRRQFLSRKSHRPEIGGAPEPERLQELKRIRAERFELMARLAQLPPDSVFFTQITMEAAEDPQFLEAMKAARIKGALVGVESVTPEGLKDIYKDFNSQAKAWSNACRPSAVTGFTCWDRSSSDCQAIARRPSPLRSTLPRERTSPLRSLSC